jgi:hypothetical protein
VTRQPTCLALMEHALDEQPIGYHVHQCSTDADFHVSPGPRPSLSLSTIPSIGSCEYMVRP